jgi:7-keto-8-aminopelargonate synthetase-like enzyme
VSGRSEVHAELERRLAEFEGTEAALVFPSGFAANTGIIPALVDEGDAIFGDAKNHASLIDGCRLSKAQRFIYPHADCDALESLLRNADRFRRRLIVTDTVFSMDGDVAPLVQIAELAERYDAMLMVDEAHATGVFGPQGRGVVEHLDAGYPLGGWMLDAGPDDGKPSSSIQHPTSNIDNEEGKNTPACQCLHDRVHIRVGTLSKALGSAGGFVCGRRSLIEWLANRARTYVFSTAQPTAVCAASLAALDIVRDEPHRRHELLQRAMDLRSRIGAQGWKLKAWSKEQGAGSLPRDQASVVASGSPLPAPRSWLVPTQIIPLFIGDPDRTMHLASALRDAGFFVPGIRPPSVPEGESLLRISMCYLHTPRMIDALVEQLGRLV